jgi:parallel beta-helix repeat protein
MRRLTALLSAAVLASLLTTSLLMTFSIVLETASAYTVRDPIYIYGNAEFTTANGVTGGSGTYSDPYVIEGWEIDASSANGIRVSDTTAHFMIRNCYVRDSGDYYYGIYLFCCVNGAVIGNILLNNDCAIVLEHSSRNTVSGNNCSLNDDAIALSNSDNNTVSDNNCSLNDNAIVISQSDNNNVSGNYCLGNDYGIVFPFSSKNMVGNNSCSDNTYGLYLLGSNNNTLRNNIVSSNVNGVYLSASVTAVFSNIFFDNTDHAFDNLGSENLWNASYPIGGNYWDDYTGIDEFSGPDQDQLGPDGIGDTPYEIDADSHDYYPLMAPSVIPPTADAGVDQTVAVGDTVTFDGSGSSDDSAVENYTWTFTYDGVGQELHEVEPTFTFDVVGTYTVTLTVTDDEGATDTDEVVITVEEAPAVTLTADAGSNQTVDAGDMVIFDGGDSTGDIVSYTWTFEYDGETEILTGESPTFVFDIAGEYDVTLTVEDVEGATDTDTVTITVEEEDEKSFIESYGLPIGIVVALAIVLMILFFVLKGRKSEKAPTDSEESPAAESESHD